MPGGLAGVMQFLARSDECFAHRTSGRIIKCASRHKLRNRPHAIPLRGPEKYLRADREQRARISASAFSRLSKLRGCLTPKAYAVITYRSISDPQKHAAYSRLAAPAVTPFGAVPRLLAMRQLPLSTA